MLSFMLTCLLIISIAHKATPKDGPLDEMLDLVILVQSSSGISDENKNKVESLVKTMPDHVKLGEHNVNMGVLRMDVSVDASTFEIIHEEPAIRRFSMRATGNGSVNLGNAIRAAKTILKDTREHAIKAILVVITGQVSDADQESKEPQGTIASIWFLHVGQVSSEIEGVMRRWAGSASRVMQLNQTEFLKKLADYARNERCREKSEACFFDKEGECWKTTWFPRAYSRVPCPASPSTNEECPKEDCEKLCDGASSEWKPETRCVDGKRMMSREVDKDRPERPLLWYCPVETVMKCPPEDAARGVDDGQQSGVGPVGRAPWELGVALGCTAASIGLSILLVYTVFAVVNRRRKNRATSGQKEPTSAELAEHSEGTSSRMDSSRKTSLKEETKTTSETNQSEQAKQKSISVSKSMTLASQSQEKSTTSTKKSVTAKTCGSLGKSTSVATEKKSMANPALTTKSTIKSGVSRKQSEIILATSMGKSKVIQFEKSGAMAASLNE